MKFELTMKGGIQPRPVKSSDVYQPVVMPLNKPQIPLNNIPASPSIPIVESAAAEVATGEFVNSHVTSTFRMHQNFG